MCLTRQQAQALSTPRLEYSTEPPVVGSLVRTWNISRRVSLYSTALLSRRVGHGGLVHFSVTMVTTWFCPQPNRQFHRIEWGALSCTSRNLAIVYRTTSVRLIREPHPDISDHSWEWSISNFSCGLTRNITSHSMENLAFHSSLRWEMIKLKILTTSLYTIDFRRLGECVLFELGSERVESLKSLCPSCCSTLQSVPQGRRAPRLQLAAQVVYVSSRRPQVGATPRKYTLWFLPCGNTFVYHAFTLSLSLSG